MNYQALTELKMREALLIYMKNAQALAADVYLELNRKLECGISLPAESLFEITCDQIFNSIDEEMIVYDENTRTELLLSRVIVDSNPYKLEFVYTIQQRDKASNLTLSEDYEIGEEAETEGEKRPLGSISYMPAIFGLHCASAAISQILK